MRARLERDDGGAAPGPLAGLGERGDLGVRAARRRGRALPHDRALGVQDHGADGGVRARRARAPRAPSSRARAIAGALGGGDGHPRIAAAAWARRRGDRLRRVVGAVDGRPGDEHVGPGLGGLLDGVGVDAAVDLDEQGEVAGVDQLAAPSRTLGSTSAMNSWPPKPGSTVMTSSVSKSGSTSR